MKTHAFLTLGIATALAFAALGQVAPSTEPAVDEKQIEALVAQLSDESSQVREAATKKLQAMGRGIYPFLRKIEPQDPATAVRIAIILDAPTPLWNGTETMKDYAARAAIDKVQKTLELGQKKIPLELTLVPAGKFVMGTAGAARAGAVNEVTLTRPFYLGVTHVTVDQFTAFVDATGYKTDAEKAGSALVLTPRAGSFESAPTPGANWRKPGFPQNGDHPVVQVTWNDARAFCDWLSIQTGRTVCLPTEAQWEFACRAGTSTQYLWGGPADSGRDWANVADASLKKDTGAAGAAWDYFNWDDGFVYTAPGKSFKPNGFGLYDMVGNAWQWCEDTPRRFDGEPVEDPRGAEPAAPNASRVLRGASWNSRPFTCVTTYRNPHPADYAYGVGGFRVELVLNETD